MDWLSRIFDITKLPSKFFAWVVALSAGYLFLPPSVQLTLHLEGLPKEYKTYAGIALVAAAAFLTINFVLWLWDKVRGWFQNRSAQIRVMEAIVQLDHSEKAVLREFFIQEKHVIELPTSHPTVAGLFRNGILSLSSRQGYRSAAGIVFPVALTDSAKQLLGPVYLDLPLNPTHAELEEVWAERPSFLQGIERHDRWRAGV
jgi:hypothetical protein